MSIVIGTLFNIVFQVLIFGFKYEVTDKIKYPNQSIKLSFHYFLVTILIYTIMGMLSGIVLSRSIFGLTLGLAIGFYVGFLGGMSPDGEVVLKHFILRYFLAYYNYFPLSIIPFLNYASDLVLLRKIGGGYIFIHRAIMNHFAKEANVIKLYNNNIYGTE